MRTFLPPAGALNMRPSLRTLELAGSENSAIKSSSISPCLGRYRFDVGGQGIQLLRLIVEPGGALGVYPAQGMLHSILVVPVRKVLAGLSAAALPAILRRVHGRDGLPQQIVEFQGLDEIGVPYQRTIRDLHVRKGGEHLRELAPAVAQGFAGAKYRGVALHDALHVQAHVGRAPRALGMTQPVQAGKRPVDGVGFEGAVRRTLRPPARAMPRRFAAEYHQIEQRVGSQAVRAMHRYTGRPAPRHESGNDDLVAAHA